MTPLGEEIARLIRHGGPITVERYMALCLGHPTLGYYTTRDPFGPAGDFVTAPEISQMFGELLGLWAGQVWLDMGRPDPVRLVEIGPGRGTLMADALRAAGRALPAFLRAARLGLVETSPVLREAQRAALAPSGVGAVWHADVEEVAGGPAIILANELLDALPVRQFVATPEGWRERLVGLDGEGRLAFGLSEPLGVAVGGRAPAGTVVERAEAAEMLVLGIARRLAAQGGAALFIDYGSAEDGVGDTLQAVSRHRFVDPLEAPGEADLTVQVNFPRLLAAARTGGAMTHGPVPQADFLAALGLARRAAALARNAAPAQARSIELAAGRLTDMAERGMGALFKAAALSHPSLVRLPGFDSAERPGD